jgi:hypothetical protein
MATSKPRKPRLPKPGQTAVMDPVEVYQSTAQASAADTEQQKRLRALIQRRHPEYSCHVDHWEFLEDTYEGGREWFDDNIFKYIKEGENEYNDRVQRAYRFNHTREVVDLVNKYLFKQNIARNGADAPPAVQKFWKRATRNGLGIRDLVRGASRRASTVGRIGVVVDNNKSDTTVSKADERAVQTYAYLVGPDQLLDYSFDDNGALNWVLIEECWRDDADPMTSTGAEEPRWRLWTKTDWTLYKEERIANTQKTRIVEVAGGQHGLGEVPVKLFDNTIGDEVYAPPSLIDDIAYLDRAVANYLSNLDAIIQDQTFSQLIMPAQNLLPGEDAYTKLLEMSTKRVFLYDGEGKAEPKYISPDPKQAQMVLAVINKIINEIYHTVGLAGERTKQDNALGIDNSSGVAKAYDFERVNALLQAKADSCEVLENWLVHIVAKWNGEPDPADDLVRYPDNFDTRGLYDEFDLAARLLLVEAPDTVRRQQMETVIDKLFPQLAKDIKAKMLAELKDWPLDPVQLAGDTAGAIADAQLPAQQTLARTAQRADAKNVVNGT